MTEAARSFYEHVKELVPPGKYRARIDSVYDGDTVWATVDSLNIKIKIRLAEINTAEIKGGTEETRAVARSQREFVRSLIEGEEVIVKISGLDKFFRHLGSIYVPEAIWSKVDWVGQTLQSGSVAKIIHDDGLYFNLSTFMLNAGICGRYITKKDK